MLTSAIGPKRTFPFLKIEAEDSALAAADLLDCFNQSRIISLPPGGQKMFLTFASATGAFCFINHNTSGGARDLERNQAVGSAMKPAHDTFTITLRPEPNVRFRGQSG